MLDCFVWVILLAIFVFLNNPIIATSMTDSWLLILIHLDLTILLMLASSFSVQILVLPTNTARSRTPDILKAHSVSCAMSDDLKELVK